MMSPDGDRGDGVASGVAASQYQSLARELLSFCLTTQHGANTMVTLSSEAADAVRSALTRAGKPDAGLRIMIESGGCAGPKFSIGLDQEPAPDDAVLESGGIRLFLDPVSQTLASGLRVDFVNREGRAGFVFERPGGGPSGCGCGGRSGGGGGCGMKR